MKPLFLLLLVLVSRCDSVRTVSPKQNPPPANESTTELKTQRCDFSEYHPLPFNGAVGLSAASIPQPQYPPEAKDRKLAGSITVRVLINVRTSLVEKACTSDGDDILRKAAETAALKIRLFPYNDYIKERYRYAEGMVVYNFVAQ